MRLLHFAFFMLSACLLLLGIDAPAETALVCNFQCYEYDCIFYGDLCQPVAGQCSNAAPNCCKGVCSIPAITPTPSATPSPSPLAATCQSIGGICVFGECIDYLDCGLPLSPASCPAEGFACCAGICTVPTPAPAVTVFATPTPSATPSPSPSPTPSPSPSSSPSLSPSPTPLPVECISNGEKQACSAAGCAGIRLCVNGYWSACMKQNLCCGVNCDDGNASTLDSCNSGSCVHKPAAKPSSAPTPQARLESPPASFAYNYSEFNSTLGLIFGQERSKLQKELADISLLEQQGRNDEALKRFTALSQQVNELLARQNESARAFNIIAAGLALAVVVTLALYFAVIRRSRSAVPQQQRKDIERRVKEIELERTELIKKFMKRECDYAAYSQMNGSLDKELIALSAKLGAKK